MTYDDLYIFDLCYYGQINSPGQIIDLKWANNTFGGTIYFAGDGSYIQQCILFFRFHKCLIHHSPVHHPSEIYHILCIPVDIMFLGINISYCHLLFYTHILQTPHPTYIIIYQLHLPLFLYFLSSNAKFLRESFFLASNIFT